MFEKRMQNWKKRMKKMTAITCFHVTDGLLKEKMMDKIVRELVPYDSTGTRLRRGSLAGI